MTTETITFAQMGFAGTVTAASASPATDGYYGAYCGMPYHIHPAATPDAFSALEVAMAADEVTVIAYSAPVLTLGDAQARQTDYLYTACQGAITGGFPCSILGSPYTYPSTMTDQANQVSIAQCSSGGLLYCQAETGEWALVEHTQSQAQQVVASFAALLNQCQSQLATLTARVNAATTVAAIQSVTWNAPKATL